MSGNIMSRIAQNTTQRQTDCHLDEGKGLWEADGK